MVKQLIKDAIYILPALAIVGAWLGVTWWITRDTNGQQ